MKNHNQKPTLKPCPFCGGEATLLEMPDGRFDTNYDVCCFLSDKCSGDKPRVRRRSQEDAVEAWNTRPQPTYAQIEAAAQAIAPLWHKFCTEQAEVLVDGKNHTSFIQELAEAALQAAGDVS